MQFGRIIVAFATASASPAIAAAEPATAARARAIEEDYAAYLGAAVVEKGIVSVAPDGEDYVVTWDLRRAIDLAAPTPGAVTINSLVYRLSPGAGGAWTLKGEHFPRIAFDLQTDKGEASGAFEFDGFRLGGVYDPTAEEFARSTLGVDALRGDFTLRNGDQRSQFAIDEQGLTIEARAKPSADGSGVDLAVAQAFAGMRESIAAPPVGDEADSARITYAMSNALGGATFTGLRAGELAGIWRYVVGHVDKAAVAEELNQRIRSALPFWNDVRAHADIRDLQFQTAAGEARLKRLGESFRVTGATSAGAAEFGVEIEDLEVKSDLAPPWFDAIWPATLSFDLDLSSGGWDEAARIALGDPGFGEKSDLSPEAEHHIRRTLLDGHPKLVLAPGRLKLPMLDLTFEGEAQAQADGAVGHFQASADSLDKTIAWLGEVALADPDARSAALAAAYLKGLAKPEDGRLVWRVDMAADGEMTVNGTHFPAPR